MRIISPTGKNVSFNSRKINYKLIPTSVIINGHTYGVTQIGNLLWITENLYEPLPSFGSLNNGKNYDSVWANFPTLNDNSQGYGILYYVSGIVQNTNGCRDYLLSLLPSGWRVPTLSDVNDLINNASWEDLMNVNEGGVDTFGFNGKCAGASARDWNYVNSQGYPGGECNLIIDDTTYTCLTVYHPSNPSRRMAPFFINWPYRIPIRLCCNIGD